MNFLGTAGEPFLFVIDFEGLNPIICKLDETPDSIRISTPGYNPGFKSQPVKDRISLTKHPMPYPEYLEAFGKVMQHLRQGNSYLVNLTFPTPVDTGLTLEDIFEVSEAPFKLLIKNKFVVFSPESFIRISGRSISSHPMKGTIDATLPHARETILNDPKESAEHNTIVDLIRNDISKVAEQVEVARFRYFDHIVTNDSEFLQVSSEIRGLLPADYKKQIGSIIDALLPAGSISGAPKKRTLEIIREAETKPRGYYTGVFGIFDGQNLESAVMIRFIEQTETGLRYRSGGGITHMSDPEAEYQEMLDKVYLQVTGDK